MGRITFSFVAGIFCLIISAFVACTATSEGGDGDDDGSGASTGQGGMSFDAGGGGQPFTGDPETCDQAAQARTSMGCHFWPTVTANNVWSIFDFAVVVANTGDNVVEATVTQGGAVVATAQIQPNALETIYLPWVTALKGPDADVCGSAAPVSSTVRAVNGAYYLQTNFPVTVYQFNALEYAGRGGPPGKDWSSCPGYLPCIIEPVGCFSFSNDASLLIPATALTPHYRVTATPGWASASIGGYIAVTGVHDGRIFAHAAFQAIAGNSPSTQPAYANEAVGNRNMG